MTQVANAFKMPYEEHEDEEIVSFDKHHSADEHHDEMEVVNHLLADDDADSGDAAVLGYD